MFFKKKKKLDNDKTKVVAFNDALTDMNILFEDIRKYVNSNFVNNKDDAMKYVFITNTCKGLFDKYVDSLRHRDEYKFMSVNSIDNLIVIKCNQLIVVDFIQATFMIDIFDFINEKRNKKKAIEPQLKDYILSKHGVEMLEALKLFKETK